MTTAPRGSIGTGIYDPSVLFDLDDILMAGDGHEMNTSLINSPIKEEPEYEPDDNRYVHSPVGLPIPTRNGGLGFSATIKQEVGGGTGASSSSSPASGMWGCPAPAPGHHQPLRNSTTIPFPVTPFNTPSQGSSAFVGIDLKGLNLNFGHNPTLSVSIKEEQLDPDETMKNFSMFPMEEDDIFQVDKADLIQGPTLAELNANDESLLTDLNFDDFLLPGQQQLQLMAGRNRPAAQSNNLGSDRFHMAELNAAFSASPSLSHFEMQKGRNNMPGMPSEDDYSHLGSTQMGFDLEQLPATVEMNFGGAGTPYSPIGAGQDQSSMTNGGLNSSTNATSTNPTPTITPPVMSLLSASLPANFGNVSLSNKLTRRTEEGGRVKPPPPYPTSPPHKSSGSSSALQELLTVRSPARLPSPNPTGSHSPSPTALRPSHSIGGARQRTSAAGGQSIPRSPNLAATNPLLLARLSSSAPAPSVLGSPALLSAGGESTTRWREPRNRLFSTSSLAEEVHGSASSISTVGILSPASFGFSHDEGFDSEDDSDHYEDFEDSDSDSVGSEEEGRGEARAGSSSSMGKKERFFWQYNVQAKGPKGQKISLAPETVDPHVLNKVQDPVFSPYCSVDGIKHSGKARRGDGNDLTPNPRKLHSIGRELDKLNRLINDMTPVSELPMAVRPKSRKEKNKLASRACRLKKKAQHEANKVKLYGLEQEHRKLMTAIAQTKLVLVGKYDLMTGSMSSAVPPPAPDASIRVERIAKSLTKVKIAGHSTEFVNRVLERVKSGEPSGGLDEI